eukprot:m.203353 g.203353  ORF g.203353 m.203353 type:complete len:448 (+) comp18845_c0_seq2:187-1530(+)
MPPRKRKASGVAIPQKSTLSTASQQSNASGKTSDSSRKKPIRKSVTNSVKRVAVKPRTTPGTGRKSSLTATSGARQIAKAKRYDVSTPSSRAPRGMSDRSFHNGSSAESKSKSRRSNQLRLRSTESKTINSTARSKASSSQSKATKTSKKSPHSTRKSTNSRRRQDSDDNGNTGMPSSRLYKVPKKTADKWVPLGDTTLKHMDGVIDYAISAVLSESVSTGMGHHRVDAEKELLILKDKMLTALRTTNGPPVPKRRKLAYQDLASANRKREEVLFATHRQVANLQAELTARTSALADAEAHLRDYTQRMEAGEKYYKRERVGTLHPTLRRALRQQERNMRQAQSEDGSAVPSEQVKATAVTEGSTVLADGSTSVVDVLAALSRPTEDQGSDSDQDLDNIMDRVCAKLSDAQPKVQRYLSWLDMAHQTAGLLLQTAPAGRASRSSTST